MILEATASVEKEINPWLSAAARFDEATRRLGLDEGLGKVLRMPAMELTVHIPVQLDDGRMHRGHCLERRPCPMGRHRLAGSSRECGARPHDGRHVERMKFVRKRDETAETRRL